MDNSVRSAAPYFAAAAQQEAQRKAEGDLDDLVNRKVDRGLRDFQERLERLELMVANLSDHLN